MRCAQEVCLSTAQGDPLLTARSTVYRMVAVMNTSTVQKQFTIETDIPYIDLRSRACANLELDPLVAELGYRVTGAEGPKTLPSSFSSDADHLQAMKRISGLISRSRSKVYGIEIVNLVRCGHSLSVLSLINGTVETHPQAHYGSHKVQKAYT